MTLNRKIYINIFIYYTHCAFINVCTEEINWQSNPHFIKINADRLNMYFKQTIKLIPVFVFEISH